MTIVPSIKHIMDKKRSVLSLRGAQNKNQKQEKTNHIEKDKQTYTTWGLNKPLYFSSSAAGRS